MKDFIYNCLLFQSGDAEITAIGVVMWIALILFLVVCFCPQIF